MQPCCVFYEVILRRSTVQVSVDGNAALTAALAGIQNLPPSFFASDCPGPQDLAEQALAAFVAEQDAAPAQIDEEEEAS